MRENKKNHGFVVLVGVIVVGAIGLAISVVLSAVGFSASSDARIFEDGRQAKFLAGSCVEEALQQIADSTPFSGSGTQTIGGLSCDYTVVNLGGHNREINAWATVDASTIRFEVVLDQVRPEINIVSWQEVESF